MLTPFIPGHLKGDQFMSFRTKAGAVAVAAALCTLTVPAAMASPGLAHSPAQVTGKKLKAGLLPPTSFQPGYSTLFASNSGGKLEHGTTFHVPSMKCSDFWLFAGHTKGFGETAFATESATSKSGQAPVLELFDQAVYQLASNKAATTLDSQIGARYKACKSVKFSDGHGGTFKESVHSRVTERVGGHQSLLLTEYETDTKTPGPPQVIVALWTLDGTDIYRIDSEPITVKAPKPTLSSLMLKLIPRVRALK
jgi:hypothetical protein